MTFISIKNVYEKFKVWRMRRRALAEVATQIAREKNNPDEGFKACIWALYQMQQLIEQFPSHVTALAYRNALLKAMWHYQTNFTSEFTDSYHSAKATLGSVIRRFEDGS